MLATRVSHLASTGSIAGVGVLANHAGPVGGAANIDGVVTAAGTASVSTRGSADECAGVLRSVPAAGALSTLCGKLDTLHVDLAGDVEAAVGTSAKGELEDGLVEETHEEVRVVIGSTAATGEAVSSGELLALAGAKLDGDEGLVGVDPHGGLAPAVQHGVLAGSVLEGCGVGAAVADPDLAVLSFRVEANLGTKSRAEGLDAVQDASGKATRRRGRAGVGGRGRRRRGIGSGS